MVLVCAIAGHAESANNITAPKRSAILLIVTIVNPFSAKSDRRSSVEILRWN